MIFYLGLLAVTTLAAGLLLAVKGLQRRYAVAYHPQGRHGLASRPGRAVTDGTTAAGLGFTRAIEAPPQVLHWDVVEQVIER